MEELEEIDQQTTESNLIITEDMRSHIYEIAKWAHLLAIVGFVLSAILVLTAFSIGAALKTNPELAGLVAKMGAIGATGFTAVCILYALAIFYPSLLMFKYAVKAKQGVLYGEQQLLADAFGKLKSLFKYWGVLVAIFIGMYVLMIVASIFSAVR